MNTPAEQLNKSLTEPEATLNQCQLSQRKPPTPEAFVSRDPFCVDTMSFAEWLQWVFIGRLRALIDAKAVLPSGSQVAPLAAELWKDQAEATLLCPVLERIDACLNGA